MKQVAHEVLKHLKPVVGLRLSIARRAADMLNVQFGEVRAVAGDPAEADEDIHCES